MECRSCYPCHCSFLPIVVFPFQNSTTDRKLVSHASPTGVTSRKPCGRCGVFHTPTDLDKCTLCACLCQAFWPGKWFYPTPAPKQGLASHPAPSTGRVFPARWIKTRCIYGLL